MGCLARFVGLDRLRPGYLVLVFLLGNFDDDVATPCPLNPGQVRIVETDRLRDTRLDIPPPVARSNCRKHQEKEEKDPLPPPHSWLLASRRKSLRRDQQNQP